MTRAQIPFKRQDLPSMKGVIWVARHPVAGPQGITGQPPFIASSPSEGLEVLVALWSDASVTALHGHVDLGTGLRTALGQIVAEELCMDLSDVHLEMGSTATAPNQGATIASNSIQTHAQPLRCAAAQLFVWGLAQSAKRFGVSASQVSYDNRGFHVPDSALVGGHATLDNPTKGVLSWNDLIQEQNICLELDLSVSTKPSHQYRLVGQSAERVDIPAKAQGDLIFVHDMRVEGMLHGRVIRPPYAGVDSGDFVGKSLIGIERESLAHIPGLVGVVVQGDFIGVVCLREEHAEQAMRDLVVHWRDWPGVGSLKDTQAALSKHPSVERELLNEGNAQQAWDTASVKLDETYVWPYQMHASIGPSCALAQWCTDEEYQATGIRLRVWAGTQNPHVLRADLALIANAPDVGVEVIRMEAAGCYGRNCADDVAADAAILSKAVNAPVRVQLSREQEHAWEPKGAAQVMQVKGGLDSAGNPVAYDFLSSYPSNGAPTLALLLTGLIEPVAKVYEMGDRTAKPPYQYPNLRVRVQDMAPILRASWLRGVSALPNSFAHESFIDELAHQAHVDPLEFRLAWLEDPRAQALLRDTAHKAQWRPHSSPQEQGADPKDPDWLKGQGVAYARYVHSKWPGFGAAYSAWVADVEVNQVTGEVHVSKVVVGHDAGMLINPKGVEHQVNGNVLQTTSRALMEEVQTHPRTGAVQSLEWGSYPILNFRQVPVIEIVHMPRQNEAPLGAGESSSVPGTAAIANAIFDATGIRLRNPPFTPEKVLAALNSAHRAIPSEGANHGANLGVNDWQDQPNQLAQNQNKNIDPHDAQYPSLSQDRNWSFIGSQLLKLTRKGLALASSVVMCLLAWGLYGLTMNPNWQQRVSPQLSMYGPKMIERGAQLAALGNCSGCHTAENGALNAGGKPIQTPFGLVFSTNITPDENSGLGRWSYKAFERAMREGVSADGHHLYPAFPYTSFKDLADEDMMSLYAWSMSQTPVATQPYQNTLSWPFNTRGLMRFWNTLFLNNPSPLLEPTTLDKQANQSLKAVERAQQPDDLFKRGEYLVGSVGHCSACHTERGMMGNEKRDSHYLSGAMVNDWFAPALTAKNTAPLPWTAEELFRYLRTGHTQFHGVASGPMAQIIKDWSSVPDEDLWAMSIYLANSMNPRAQTDDELSTMATVRLEQSKALEVKARGLDVGQRQFEGSCSACHHEGGGPNLLGTNAPLSLNTNVHGESPNNLIQIILKGCPTPANAQMGFMPAFKDSLTDSQVVDLVHYIRARYAPGKPEWTQVNETLEKLRQMPTNN